MSFGHISSQKTIYCSTKGNTIWSFEGVELPSNAVVSGKHDGLLTISDIDLNNSGLYTCYGLQDLYTHFMATAELIVLGNTLEIYNCKFLKCCI